MKCARRARRGTLRFRENRGIAAAGRRGGGYSSHGSWGVQQPSGGWPRRFALTTRKGNQAMQRLLAAAIFSFAAVALNAAPASAWFLHHPCKQCDKCGTFYVRPYNAFSPVAFGNITFAGYTMPGTGFGDPNGGPGCASGVPIEGPSGTTVVPGDPLPNVPGEMGVSGPSSDAPMRASAFRTIQNAVR